MNKATWIINIIDEKIHTNSWRVKPGWTGFRRIKNQQQKRQIQISSCVSVMHFWACVSVILIRRFPNLEKENYRLRCFCCRWLIQFAHLTLTSMSTYESQCGSCFNLLHKISFEFRKKSAKERIIIYRERCWGSKNSSRWINVVQIFLGLHSNAIRRFHQSIVAAIASALCCRKPSNEARPMCWLHWPKPLGAIQLRPITNITTIPIWRHIRRMRKRGLHWHWKPVGRQPNG